MEPVTTSKTKPGSSSITECLLKMLSIQGIASFPGALSDRMHIDRRFVVDVLIMMLSEEDIPQCLC